MSRWQYPETSSIPLDFLTWCQNDFLARLLWQRGIRTVNQARAFLNPHDYEPAPATDLPDLALAAEHLSAAIDSGRPICVWGDFDVDGQTSTALLVTVLRHLGGQVCYYVPHRITEGHGIALSRLEALLSGDSQNPDHHILTTQAPLFLTCDTGIEAHQAVALVRRAGADIIITDHHDLGDRLPAALAVVNPKRLPIEHPLHELPGVGVAYKLMAYLARRRGDAAIADKQLDLVALGIVADVALQVADTRYLLQRGLDQLRRTQRVGLQALFDMTNLKAENITSEHIGFGLAPRLNALGRLGDANQGVELLTTDRPGRARILAAQLDSLNERRKLLVDRTLLQALAQLEDTPSLREYNVIVLSHRNWHPGVLGIVCSRLVDQFHRPVILLAQRDGQLRGSARSVTGCDIHRALQTQASLLQGFGGHPMAAGMRLDPRNLGAFRQGLSQALAGCLPDGPPPLTIDAEISLAELTPARFEAIRKLAPFGAGNRPVVLALSHVQIVHDAIFGRARTHRKVTVRDLTEHAQQVVWWNGAEKTAPQGPFDLAVTVSLDHPAHIDRVQLLWRDFQQETIPAAFRSPELVDWRQASAGEIDALRHRDGLLFSGAVGMPNVPRYSLTAQYPPFDTALVVWQAPPGHDTLRRILAHVKPHTIHLIAGASALDRPRPFVQHLMGLVKYAVQQYNGRITPAELAVLMNQRETTVRLGLAWLVQQGKLRVIVKTDETWVVRVDDRPAEPDAAIIEETLRELLAETAAYRTFFRSAGLQALAL